MILNSVLVLVLLQLRKERFVEELESYAKQVEEFQTYGDMSEIQRYLKKARALDEKLQGAADKVKESLIGTVLTGVV